MLLYVVLLLALIAVLVAWNTYRKQNELKERIAQVNSRVYHLRREMQEAQDKAEQERLALKVQLLQFTGDLKVTPEMTVGEAAALHPQAQQVLAGFHLGGCASCAVDDSQTLAEAAALNDRDLSPILVALNTLVVEGNNGRARPGEQVRTPNVQLDF